ncbi:MAG: glucuronate isomerase [Hymenobacter sp.]|nr:glucuronate isomerase [Hymenobacter sp.]
MADHATAPSAVPGAVPANAEAIFAKARTGTALTAAEVTSLQLAVRHFMHELDHKRSWISSAQLDGPVQLLLFLNRPLAARGFESGLRTRSFLAYPRHEYYRRRLCDALGLEVEAGRLAMDIPQLGHLVHDVCFARAKARLGVSTVVADFDE